jgi:hypothetical protein
VSHAEPYAPSRPVHEPRNDHRTDAGAEHQQRQGEPGGRGATGDVLRQEATSSSAGSQTHRAEQLRDDQDPHGASLERWLRRLRSGRHRLHDTPGPIALEQVLDQRQVTASATSNTCPAPIYAATVSIRSV